MGVVVVGVVLRVARVPEILSVGVLCSVRLFWYFHPAATSFWSPPPETAIYFYLVIIKKILVSISAK